MKIQITYTIDSDKDFIKMKLIKILKEYTGFGLKEAKDKVDCNDIILQDISHDRYLDIIRELEEHIESGNIVIKKLDEKDKITSAKKAIYDNTDYVLLDKNEYEELIKFKELYHDLKSSVRHIQNKLNAILITC